MKSKQEERTAAAAAEGSDTASSAVTPTAMEQLLGPFLVEHDQDQSSLQQIPTTEALKHIEIIGLYFRYERGEREGKRLY